MCERWLQRAVGASGSGAHDDDGVRALGRRTCDISCTRLNLEGGACMAPPWTATTAKPATPLVGTWPWTCALLHRELVPAVTKPGGVCRRPFCNRCDIVAVASWAVGHGLAGVLGCWSIATQWCCACATCAGSSAAGLQWGGGQWRAGLEGRAYSGVGATARAGRIRCACAREEGMQAACATLSKAQAYTCTSVLYSTACVPAGRRQGKAKAWAHATRPWLGPRRKTMPAPAVHSHTL